MNPNGDQPTPAARLDWTSEECDALLEAYFRMVKKDAAGESYVKRQVILELQRDSLKTRTHGSIEYKFQNVSAVLAKKGLPFLKGYVPAANAQRLLAERVGVYLGR